MYLKNENEVTKIRKKETILFLKMEKKYLNNWKIINILKKNYGILPSCVWFMTLKCNNFLENIQFLILYTPTLNN